MKTYLVIAPIAMLMASTLVAQDRAKEVTDTLANRVSLSSESDEDIEAVKRAVLDYVEGVYEVKPELIERSVHPDLKKFGYWRPEKNEEFNAGGPMTFDQLVELAKVYNANDRIPKDAPKEVVIFEVMNKMASAKLTAAWGVDYFHLVKEEGKWKILQVVWQSQPKKSE